MSFFQRFFMIFGILSFIFFLVLIAGGAYLWVNDPFGLKPILFPASSESTEVPSAAANSNDGSAASFLTPEQEKLLQAAGINVASLPTEITPELKVCAEAALGKERVAALKAGAQPTLSDLLKAKACINQ